MVLAVTSFLNFLFVLTFDLLRDRKSQCLHIITIVIAASRHSAKASLIQICNPNLTFPIHSQPFLVEFNVKTRPTPTTTRRAWYSRNLELAAYELHRIIDRAPVQQL